VWLANAGVSAVLLFRVYYLDSRTATSFITDNLLLALRFAKGYGVRAGEGGAGEYRGRLRPRLRRPRRG
jgi:hypothetical protein